MRWQEISVGRIDPKSPIQSREISPTRAGSQEGSGEALFVDCTAQQCPGEQQNCWPGLVDSYPNPDAQDHGEGTWRRPSFPHLSQPDVSQKVDVTSQAV